MRKSFHTGRGTVMCLHGYIQEDSSPHLLN